MIRFILFLTAVTLVVNRSEGRNSLSVQWPKPTVSPSATVQGIKDLIGRVLDNAPSAHLFQVEINQQLAVNGKDVFQLSNGTSTGTILISASSGVAAAMGFNYYLKYVGNSSFYWSGKNIQLSNSSLPSIMSPIKIVANDLFRWYGNPCTFSYSAVFWSFERWGKELDWMAMNGINLVYATTGMEYIFGQVFQQLGFTQAQLDTYFTGPAFLAWHRMGNLQKHGGPLPQNWLISQYNLAKQIIGRMTEIGIIPVLPAFTGFMPRSAPSLFPKAKFYFSSDWCGFGCNESCLPYLDPIDPLFQQIATAILRQAISDLGITTHYYACDLFNEMTPPDSDLSYLADVNAGIINSMLTVDPQAVWVMQGWLFLSGFWTTDRVRSYLSKVPSEHMIILDLFSEDIPQYSRFESYYQHYYIWNMLHDFGGNNYLFGTLTSVNKGPQFARNFSGGYMLGVGITMEGINQNEIMYEFALEQAWRQPLSQQELNDWLVGFANRRYAQNQQALPGPAVLAWQELGNSVYLDNPGGSHSLLLRQPRLNMRQGVNYDLQALWRAWNLLVSSSTILNGDLFRYDLIDITKEVLIYVFADEYTQLMLAYNNSDLYGVATQAAILTDVLADLESALASDRRFLLGNWVGDALQFAQTEEEIHFYNLNAKLQISIWGNNYTLELFDYASKLWSGMIKDYYAPRWNVFFNTVLQSLLDGHPVNEDALTKSLFIEAELPFFMLDKDYPTTAQGDSIAIARQLFNKYSSKLSQVKLSVTNEMERPYLFRFPKQIR